MLNLIHTSVTSISMCYAGLKGKAKFASRYPLTYYSTDVDLLNKQPVNEEELSLETLLHLLEDILTYSHG